MGQTTTYALAYRATGACLPPAARFAAPLVTLRFAPLVAVLSLALSRLVAAEPSILPQLTAKSTRITDQESIFSGEARLAHKDVVLYADEVVYRNQDRVAIARGNVIFIRGAQRLVSEEITYHLDDQTFSVGRFRAGQGTLFASGAHADGTQKNLAVNDAAVTYGEPDPLSPTIRARTFRYTEAENPADSVARVEGARLGVGSTNILPLPTFSETPQDPAIAGLEARAGFSGNLGGELSLGATTSITPAVRLGGDLGLFTKRGALLGPIGNYDTRGAEGLGAKGRFRTGFIQDQGDPGTDIRGDAIRNERGYVEWQHQQAIAPGLDLAGQVYYWSDSYVTRDFRSDDFTRLQTPDTWFEATKAGDNFVVSLFTRVRVNDYALVQERLPELRFDGLPVEIGAGIYHRINAGVAILKEDDPLTDITTRSQRADLYYGAYRPFSPREWFSITPLVGGRVTHYQRTNPGASEGQYTRALGEAGFDAKLFETSATWDYKNQRWAIDGLRHIVTPTVAYRLSPAADIGRGAIPRIDDDPFNTYLRPLGLADRRDTDRLPALNTFRLGLANTLQTRDQTHGSRDLARLDLAVDQYAGAETAATDNHRRDRTDVHAFAALQPARWLRFDLYERQTVQTGTMQELNTGLTLKDANVWSLRVGTHYLADPVSIREIQEYTAAYGLRLSEIYSILARVRFDSRAGDFTEQALTLSQRLSRFWTLNYQFTAYDGPRREEDFGFAISIESAGF